jgi:hypothetical protein
MRGPETLTPRSGGKEGESGMGRSERSERERREERGSHCVPVQCSNKHVTFEVVDISLMEIQRSQPTEWLKKILCQCFTRL